MTTPGAALSGGGASPPQEARLNRQREPLPTDVASLPALPAGYAHALDGALRALGIQLGSEARTAIDGHVRLLLAWNAAINLTAITDPAEVARRHVADSLSALEVIRSGAHATILDIGSGGGFPGLPLAAALADSRVLLVDATAKKVAFLDAARRATGLAGRVDVAAARAESIGLRGPRGGWDVVTARAVGSLADLVELAMPVLGPGGRLVAWKRGDIAVELEAARRAAAALGSGEPEILPVAGSVDLPGHVLVIVRKVAATPAGFPRDPAVRRRRPW
ncbi:MAG: 16S rRNA (guanine(527)-N(7))-methyltransferase RsmG [Chloroflexota bacterium]|nr:MAG: 16S rRNA (guanine(527)-N(7))-methyltransferase RsmG [Chloroflexota bacterium]